MDPAGLINVLSAIHPLSVDFKQALEKELIALSLPKNHILLEAPKIAAYAYFLENGFAMSYTFNEGEKQVEAFWKPGQLVVSSQSFFEQAASMENIQLVEKSDLLCLSYGSIEKLFEKYPEAHTIYRKMMIRHYTYSRARIRDLQQLSTLQRLEKLLTVFPGLEQKVSQDSIASYLGITPQSLSRMKKRQLRGSPHP